MTDNANAGVVWDLIRSFASAVNIGIYTLLSFMYEIFFNVSSVQLFENETIKNFYGRIQLIIGVFMIFKLAVSILQGIMDPEKFAGPKEGFGSIITRVIISLALLTVLVPINVPDVENANSFEKYINNNGLLFGTLYSLQERILSNNTLGRLILGTTDEATELTADQQAAGMTQADIQNQMLQRSARIFTSTILKGFVRINLLPEEERVSDDESDQQNWYCGHDLSDQAVNAIEAYQALDVAPSTILSDDIINVDCDIQSGFLGIRWLGGEGKYVFAFNWIVSAIVGVIFLVVLVLFTVDIAIRSIKLSILRLLAPIPIISYIEPKSSKDGGMFSSWVKTLTSTYLDLFLRLAIIYFVIFLIQDMIANGIIINQATGTVGIVSVIFIWIGLFFFAKMAPKFIKDALGIKGTGMSNIGLSGALAAAGAVRQGGSLMDAWQAAGDATDAQIQAYNQGKPLPSLGMSYNAGKDFAAKMLTGDERMTARKMNQGKWQLWASGITPQSGKRVHDAAVQAQAFSDRMSSDFVAGVGQYMDKDGTMHDYMYEDNQGNLHSVMDWVTDKDGNRVQVLNKDKASLALSQQRTIAGKLASRDKKIDAELRRTGQARGYRDSIRRNNEGSTPEWQQAVVDRYLSKRHDQSWDPVQRKYGEKGPDTYQAYDPNDFQGYATGYDIKTHN